MTLKERVKYMIVGIISFLSIPASMIGVIFKPAYKKVYYGQSNDIFKYAIGAFVLLILFILIKCVLIKKMHITYKKDTNPLSIKKTIIVFVLTFGIIFAISAYLGFHVKLFYELGNNTTGFKMLIHAIKYLYYIVMCLFIVLMIENFQYALDGTFKSKKIISSYIPLGGLVTLLLYGTYALIMGIGTMKILYFFLILVYGEIYLLTNRSFIKTYAPVMLIFLF